MASTLFFMLTLQMPPIVSRLALVTLAALWQVAAPPAPAGGLAGLDTRIQTGEFGNVDALLVRRGKTVLIDRTYGLV